MTFFCNGIWPSGGTKSSSRSSITISNLLAYTALRPPTTGVAIQAYRKLLELAPERATIYLSLGQAYFAKQDYTDAIQALEQAKRLLPRMDEPTSFWPRHWARLAAAKK
jgi:cytochrome c-type biogenesis protein CcmH/NrfG